MKELVVNVEQDHIEKQTQSPIKQALKELIWNSLDADAGRINIILKRQNEYIEEINIEDDGHGLSYTDAEKFFSQLGGSQKQFTQRSPKNRKFHGREGRGRFKAFSIGTLVNFISTYYDKSEKKRYTFQIEHDYNNIKRPKLDDKKATSSPAGFKVAIYNINEKNLGQLTNKSDDIVNDLEKSFAAYHQCYNDFDVYYDNQKLDFSKAIKANSPKSFIVAKDGENYNFNLNIIEWNNKTSDKKYIYLCGASGIAYKEILLGIKSDNTSVYLMSDYIEKLNSNNEIELAPDSDDVLKQAISESKKLVRTYLREKEHVKAFEFIKELKEKKIYPYTKSESDENEVEKTERQLFDIIALNINQYSDFYDKNKNDIVNSKMFFTLLKELLSQKKNYLEVLSEVIKLPEDKIRDLKELLEEIPFQNIISTANEVRNRLKVIHGIRDIFHKKEIRQNMLERKHFQKIVENETWIFGDDYTIGATDQTLRNVLKAHINHLGRSDFQEELDISNDELCDIPDLCLFKQYSLGQAGRYKNLVVEIKRPSKKITEKELGQIQKYAFAVEADTRFTKENTEWLFILLINDLDDYSKKVCEQKDREWGQIHNNIYVKIWDDVLNQAESRHKYILDKLNYRITDENQGINHLKEKYNDIFADVEKSIVTKSQKNQK